MNFEIFSFEGLIHIVNCYWGSQVKILEIYLFPRTSIPTCSFFPIKLWVYSHALLKENRSSLLNQNLVCLWDYHNFPEAFRHNTDSQYFFWDSACSSFDRSLSTIQDPQTLENICGFLWFSFSWEFLSFLFQDSFK
jgi:hypothetical protein